MGGRVGGFELIGIPLRCRSLASRLPLLCRTGSSSERTVAAVVTLWADRLVRICRACRVSAARVSAVSAGGAMREVPQRYDFAVIQVSKHSSSTGTLPQSSKGCQRLSDVPPGTDDTDGRGKGDCRAEHREFASEDGSRDPCVNAQVILGSVHVYFGVYN